MQKKINWKQLFIPANIGAAFAIAMILFILVTQRHDYSANGRVSFNDTEAAVTELPLQKGRIEQQLRCIAEVDYIDVLLSNSGKEKEKISVRIYDKNKKRIRKEEIIAEPSDGAMQTVKVPVNTKQCKENPGEMEVIYIQFTKTLIKSNVIFYTQPKRMYADRYGTVITGSDMQLRMDVQFRQNDTFPFFYILTALLVFGGIALFFIKKDLRPERVFLPVALVAGITLALVNPDSQECDGRDHFLRAMDVSYGNILSPYIVSGHDANEITVPANLETLSMLEEIPPNSAYASFLYDRLTQQTFSKKETVMHYEGGVNAIFYWPQALGLAIGRMLDCNVYLCVFMARFLNLLCYIALVYFAIKKMPFYKNFLTLIALMPISLYQAASCSPDSVLNGICILFIATCLSYAFDRIYEPKQGISAPLGWKQALTLGIQLTMIFLCKYIYVVLGLLVFVIPEKRFGEKKDYGKAFLLALLPLICVVAITGLNVITSVSNTQAADGSDLTQLQFVIQNPQAFIKTVVRSIETCSGTWISGLATYGWMTYPLGALVFFVPCLITIGGFLEQDRMPEETATKQRVLLFVAFLLTFCTLLFALYIGDGRINKVGDLVVSGIQGRYFVPLLILPFMALGSTKIKNQIPNFKNRTLAVSALFLAYSVAQLMSYCY